MSVTAFAWMLTPPGRLKVWKHEWYHVVTNSQGHVLSPSGLPKVAKKCQKKPKVMVAEGRQNWLSLEIKYETSDMKSNPQSFSTCSTSKD